jgi:lipid-binding SYLF domain-containing protein
MKRARRINLWALGMLLLALSVAAGCRTPVGDTAAQQRAYALRMRDETLAELYKARPETKAKTANAPGYAVFSNININVLLLSSGNGYGVIRDKATDEDTIMNMRMLGVGFGAGVKDFRAAMIFKTRDALRMFIEEGWEFGGHADAAVKAGDTGIALNVADEVTGDIEIYQFTESGIALQATIAGTKYWKNDLLN